MMAAFEEVLLVEFDKRFDVPGGFEGLNGEGDVLFVEEKIYVGHGAVGGVGIEVMGEESAFEEDDFDLAGGEQGDEVGQFVGEELVARKVGIVCGFPIVEEMGGKGRIRAVVPQAVEEGADAMTLGAFLDELPIGGKALTPGASPKGRGEALTLAVQPIAQPSAPFGGRGGEEGAEEAPEDFVGLGGGQVGGRHVYRRLRVTLLATGRPSVSL